MSNNPKKVLDGKAPQFVIPASYKGHQTVANPPGRPGLSNISSNSVKKPEEAASLLNGIHAVNENTPTAGAPQSLAVSTSKAPYLLASPSGMLDLSLYNYAPGQELEMNRQTNGNLKGRNLAAASPMNAMDVVTNAEDDATKEKKKRRFRRPRKNSKLDRLIKFLEDKRVKDDANGEELEDLQMPKLRKVLNIIFVTLGVCFLLAVIIVIVYTTITSDSESLRELCAHRHKEADVSDNRTSTETASTTNTRETNSNSQTPTHPFYNPSVPLGTVPEISNLDQSTDQYVPNVKPELPLSRPDYPYENSYRPAYVPQEQPLIQYPWLENQYPPDEFRKQVANRPETVVNDWWPPSNQLQGKR